MLRNWISRSILPALACSISMTSLAQNQPRQLVSVAFYNFENLFDTVDDPKKMDEDFTPEGAYHYGTRIYKAKLHNLATVLKQLGTPSCPDGPAIIGTAEIENDQVLQDLIAQPEIQSRNYRFVHFESPDSRGIDVALLYNPRIFQVLQARALYTDIRSSGEKGGHTRDVLHVQGLLGGDSVHIFVNHWPSRKGGEEASAPLRMIAAQVSKRVIDSLMRINCNTRVILMGDLNDDPTNKSVTVGLGATGNQKKLRSGGLFNPFTVYYQKGIGTLGFSDAWDLFDQIMISSGYMEASGKNWQFLRAEIFSRDFLKESFGTYKGYPHRSFEGSQWINGYSDHFPVLVYLSRPVPR